MRLPVLLFVFFSLLTSSRTSAQLRIRDIYANAPDSIFPLLTKNNRLDQLDFKENNMPAVVKNRFDDRSELLLLTDSYLQLHLSDHLLVEMRLLPDSTFCMVQTYKGPAPDSRLRFFDAVWNELPAVVQVPAADDFLADDIDIDTRLSLQALPLIQATLSPDGDDITFELQTSELTREQKKRAEGKVHRISRSLSQPE